MSTIDQFVIDEHATMLSQNDPLPADSLSPIGAVALGTGVMIGAGLFALTSQMAEMTRSLVPLPADR